MFWQDQQVLDEENVEQLKGEWANGQVAEAQRELLALRVAGLVVGEGVAEVG